MHDATWGKAIDFNNDVVLSYTRVTRVGCVQMFLGHQHAKTRSHGLFVQPNPRERAGQRSVGPT